MKFMRELGRWVRSLRRVMPRGMVVVVVVVVVEVLSLAVAN